MNNMKYIFIWLLPFSTLCVCGYNFIYATWIFMTVSDTDSKSHVQFVPSDSTGLEVH